MIREMEALIKMWSEMKKTTETADMKKHYEGMIAGMETALKIARKSRKEKRLTTYRPI